MVVVVVVVVVVVEIFFFEVLGPSWEKKFLREKNFFSKGKNFL